MGRAHKASHLISQVLLGVVVTVFTGVMGAPFLRVMRREQGSPRYWLFGIALTLSAWALGLIGGATFLGAVWLTVGVYSEMEERGWSWPAAGGTAITLGSLAALFGFGHALRRLGVMDWPGLVEFLRARLEPIQLFATLSPADLELMAEQLPSLWVIVLTLGLGSALIFERRVLTWYGLSRERWPARLNLLEFRVPDAFIWVAMTAFLITMVNFDTKALAAIGANVVNVSVVLYFFQGLAVLEVLLRTVRAGAFTRLAVYLILVGQLFFVLSVVGFIDYWVDFRRRLRRTGAPSGNDTQFGGSV